MLPHSLREYDLGHMSVIFAQAGVRFYARAQAALEASARIIENVTKDKLGNYQKASGPHPEWAPLADSTREQRAAQGYTPNDPLLRSGKMKASVSHEVWGLEAAIGSPLPEMLYNEMGSRDGTLPPRPSLGPAAFESRARVLAILGNASVRGVMNADLGRSDGTEIARPGYSDELRT